MEEKIVELVLIVAFIIAAPAAFILFALAGAGSAAGIFAVITGAAVSLTVALIVAFIA